MLAGMDVLLLDIEGTITDIAFVQKVLFPYVRQNLHSYLDQKWLTEEVKADLDALCSLSKSEYENGDHAIVPFSGDFDQAYSQKGALLETTISNVNHWMDLEKKLGPLKQLQGHVWRDAYQSDQVKGHLYPDVIPALKRIVNDGRMKIYIFSSGSVLAQKLLFTYSCEGDVTNLLSGYFDTTIGPKIEAASYARISESIGVPANRILFLTDVEREAYPASTAGCKVGLVIREGNASLTDQAKSDFLNLYSLNELF